MGSTKFADIPGPLVDQVVIPPSAAADATLDYPVFRAPFPCRVRKVTIVPGATITGVATNYANLNVKTWTDAATPVATERANRDYASATNEVAMKARDLYAPADPLALGVGEYVSVEKEKVGTGLALPPILVITEYESQ